MHFYRDTKKNPLSLRQFPYDSYISKKKNRKKSLIKLEAQSGKISKIFFFLTLYLKETI